MAEENINQEFRLKNIEETRNFFIKEIDHNELMSKKHKKICTHLNYIEHFLTLFSTVSVCILVFTFAPCFVIPLGVASSAIGLKISAITAGTKKYKSIIIKKKHDKIVLLAKNKLNSIEVLNSKSLFDPYFSHVEFV